MIKEVFYGCIPIAGDDYGDTANIQVIPAGTIARMTLQYPFQYPLTLKLDREGGYRLHDVIDLVRFGFGKMYQNSTAEMIPGMINQHVESDRYGQAFHSIKDLVIESISYNDEHKEVFISIGS